MIDLGIELLQYRSRIKVLQEDEKIKLYDPVRKKYIILGKEEMVRQLFLHYLLDELKIAKGRISVERKIAVFKLNKRFDIVVFDKQGRPNMIVECKSSNIALDQNVVDQAGIYNQKIQAPFLCITNGKKTFLFELNFETKEFKSLADFQKIQSS